MLCLDIFNKRKKLRAAAAMAILTVLFMAGCEMSPNEQNIGEVSESSAAAATAESTEASVPMEMSEIVTETESETAAEETEAASEKTDASAGKTTFPEEKDGMRVAELKDLEGKVWRCDEEDAYYIFGKDQCIVADSFELVVNDSVFENGRLVVSYDDEDYEEAYIMYFNDGRLYSCYEDDPDEFVVLDNYPQPDLSLNYLDGEWSVLEPDAYSIFLSGYLDIKDGKGTYTENAPEADVYDAEFISGNDRITLVMGENKSEFTTYFIIEFDSYEELFLINGENVIILVR